MSANAVAPGTRRIGALAAVLASAVAVTLPGAASAATALTGEVQLNQATTGFQDNPEISMLPNGQFSAVWEDANTQHSIARSFSAALAPLGNEFPAHPVVASGLHDNPVVALDSGGNLKTAWDVLNGPAIGDGDTTRAVLFSLGPATGPVAGGGIVNTTVASNQDNPAIAARSTGEFAVAWEGTSGVGGAVDEVYARRYDAAGTAVDAAEVQINGDGLTNPPGGPVVGDQDQPSISAAADSGPLATDPAYVVGFQGVDGGANGGAFARFIRGNGSVAGPSSVPVGNIPLNPAATSAGDQFGVDVASDSDGKFTAVWSGPDATARGIYARRFNFPAGSPIGNMDEQPVNQVTAGLDSQPSVATDGNGNFVVAWYRVGVGGADVFARTFDSNAIPTNDEIKVNTTAMLLCGCAGLGVAMDSDKNFVVVWEADAPGGAVDDEVFARRFSTVTLPDPPPDDPADPGPTAQAATLASTKPVKVARSRRYKLPVSCPAGGADCAGSVSAKTAKAVSTAKKRIVGLGSADFTVATGQTQEVGLRLSRKALKLLKARKKLNAAITVTTQTPSDPLQSSATVKLKAPKG